MREGGNRDPLCEVHILNAFGIIKPLSKQTCCDCPYFHTESHPSHLVKSHVLYINIQDRIGRQKQWKLNCTQVKDTGKSMLYKWRPCKLWFKLLWIIIGKGVSSRVSCV